jgi:hypothetical protein
MADRDAKLHEAGIPAAPIVASHPSDHDCGKCRSRDTTGLNLPYDSYVGDTTHRFYQMWQQSDCSIRHATKDSPAGCLNDLYPCRHHLCRPGGGQGWRQFDGVLQRAARGRPDLEEAG